MYMEFKSIDTLSITECCEQLNLRKEDLPEALQNIVEPSERDQLLIEQLQSLLEEDKSAIESCITIEQYEGYLSTWIDGLYHDYARTRIAQLKAEAKERAFYQKNKDSISGCEAYLQKYPNGRFANDIREALAYASCLDLTDYEAYLCHYPEGKMVAAARREIDRIKCEEEASYDRAKDISSCKEYLREYPHGRFVNEVNNRLICVRQYRTRWGVPLVAAVGILFIVSLWIYMDMLYLDRDWQEYTESVIAEKDSVIAEKDSVILNLPVVQTFISWRSDNKRHGSQSFKDYVINIEHPSIFVFDYEVSSEENHDKLSISIKRPGYTSFRELWRFSGKEAGAQYIEFNDAGRYTIHVSYTKDETVNKYYDFASVKNIRLIPFLSKDYIRKISYNYDRPTDSK